MLYEVITGRVSLDEAYRYAYERTLADTARTAPPAITPVPLDAGFRNTRPVITSYSIHYTKLYEIIENSINR